MDIRQYLSALDAILSAFQSLARAIVVSSYDPDDKVESTSRLTESLVEPPPALRAHQRRWRRRSLR